MDPEIQQQIMEQLSELAELLSQQNSLMRENISAMESMAGAASTSTRSASNPTAAGATAGATRYEQAQQKAAAATNNTSDKLDKLGEAFSKAGDIIGSFATNAASTLTSFAFAASSGKEGLTKYGEAIDAASNTVKQLTNNLGLLGSIINIFVDVFQKEAKDALELGDQMIQFQRETRKVTGVLPATVTEFTRLANQAGFARENMAKLQKSIASIGPELRALGLHAGEGAVKFAKIANIPEDIRQKFSRLGVSFDELANYQAKYIRMQSLSGNAYQLQAKSAQQIQKESLAYAETLMKLSALTGKQTDEIQAQQEAVAAQLNEQMAIMRTRAEIKELRESGDEEGARALERQETELGKIRDDLSGKFGQEIGSQIANAIRTGTPTEQTQALGISMPEVFGIKGRLAAGEAAESISPDIINSARQNYENISRTAPTDYMSEQDLKSLLGLNAEVARYFTGMGGASEEQRIKAIEEAIAKGGLPGRDKVGDEYAKIESEQRELASKQAETLIGLLEQGLPKLRESIENLENTIKIAIIALGVLAAGNLAFKGIKAFRGRAGAKAAAEAEAAALRKGAGTAATEAEAAAAGAAKRAKPVFVTDPVTGQRSVLTGAEAAAARAAESGAAGAASSTAAAAAKEASMLSKLLKGGGRLLGRAAAPLTVALGAYEGYSGWKEAGEAEKRGELSASEASRRKGEAAGSAVVGTGGALAGAAAGAAIGSVVPVVGTIIGGLLGGALGYWAGSKVGGAAGGAIGSAVGPDETKPQQQNAATQGKTEEAAKNANDSLNSIVNSFGMNVASFGKIVQAFAITSTALIKTLRSAYNLDQNEMDVGDDEAETQETYDRTDINTELADASIEHLEKTNKNFELFNKGLDQSGKLMKALHQAIRDFIFALTGQDIGEGDSSTGPGATPTGPGAGPGSSPVPTGDATVDSAMQMQFQKESGGGKMLRAQGFSNAGTMGGAYGMGDAARKSAFNSMSQEERQSFTAQTGFSSAPTLNDLVSPDGKSFTSDKARIADELLARQFTKNTIQTLTQRLGRTPTLADVRGAHWLGEAGYIALLEAYQQNPSMTMSAFYASHPNWTKPDLSQFPATVGELVAKISEQASGFGAGAIGQVNQFRQNMQNMNQNMQGMPYGGQQPYGPQSGLMFPAAQAAGGIVPLGKALQGMGLGLRVDENIYFDGKHPAKGAHSSTGGHYDGTAIDVNAPGSVYEAGDKYWGPMFDQIARAGQAAGYHTLWRTKDHYDHIHFQYSGSMGQNSKIGMPQAEKGGILKGPDSGYPAMLHGTEMVIPLDNKHTRSQSSYTVNGRPATKKQYDAFMKENPELTRVQDMAKSMLAHSRSSRGSLDIDSMLNSLTGKNIPKFKLDDTNTSYTVNGQPATKKQYDAFMKQNPDLAKLQDLTEGMVRNQAYLITDVRNTLNKLTTSYDDSIAGIKDQVIKMNKFNDRVARMIATETNKAIAQIEDSNKPMKVLADTMSVTVGQMMNSQKETMSMLTYKIDDMIDALKTSNEHTKKILKKQG